MQTNRGYDLVLQTLSTASHLLRESQRFFRPLGLSAAQFNVLNLLGQHPDGLTQRRLSELLVVDRSNVTTLLDRIEKLGWARREEVPGDRRAWCVKLTPAGKKLWEKVLPRYLAAVGSLGDTVTVPEAKQVLNGLQKLEAAARDWKPV